MILQWVMTKRPGESLRIGDELRIIHANGDISSFWQRDGVTLVPPGLDVLGIYSEIDGADLFSSAFKIASISKRKYRGNVVIVPSVSDMISEAERLECIFPDGAIPFMIQAGIGLYAVHNGVIYEWDTIEEAISGMYKDLTSILSEWLAAVN